MDEEFDKLARALKPEEVEEADDMFDYMSSTWSKIGHSKPTRPRSHTAQHSNQPAKPRDMTRLRLRDEVGREKAYRDSICTMCTTGSHVSKHTHFSTASMRRFAARNSPNLTFLCPFCKVLEPALINVRKTKRVVLTSSTLYGVWDQPKMPDNHTHFEMEAIVGGRVRDMKRALERNYFDMPHRHEIIVIAGINNVGEGQQASDIIREMEDLREMVREHSRKFEHEPPSYVSFSTLIIPPKFCSLDLPPNPAEPWLTEWVPTPQFINRYSVVKEVNRQVRDLNLSEGVNYLHLHMQGIKVFKSGKTQHKFDNKPGATQIWREYEVFRKLHFTPEIKLKIVGFINSCFKGNESANVELAGHV